MGMGTGTDIDMSVRMGIDMGMGMRMGARAWGDPPLLFLSFFFYAGQKKFTHTSRRCGFRHLSAKKKKVVTACIWHTLYTRRPRLANLCALYHT